MSKHPYRSFLMLAYLTVFSGILWHVSRITHASSSAGSVIAQDCTAPAVQSCVVTWIGDAVLTDGWEAQLWVGSSVCVDESSFAAGVHTCAKTLNVNTCLDGTFITHSADWSQRVDYGPAKGCAIAPSFSFTINNSTSGIFNPGNAWMLKLSSNLFAKDVWICAIDPTGTQTCTPAANMNLQPKTDAAGSWIASGSFASAHIGSWQEWARIYVNQTAYVESNRITFTVANALPFSSFYTTGTPSITPTEILHFNQGRNSGWFYIAQTKPENGIAFWAAAVRSLSTSPVDTSANLLYGITDIASGTHYDGFLSSGSFSESADTIDLSYQQGTKTLLTFRQTASDRSTFELNVNLPWNNSSFQRQRSLVFRRPILFESGDGVIPMAPGADSLYASLVTDEGFWIDFQKFNIASPSEVFSKFQSANHHWMSFVLDRSVGDLPAGTAGVVWELLDGSSQRQPGGYTNVDLLLPGFSQLTAKNAVADMSDVGKIELWDSGNKTYLKKWSIDFPGGIPLLFETILQDQENGILGNYFYEGMLRVLHPQTGEVVGSGMLEQTHNESASLPTPTPTLPPQGTMCINPSPLSPGFTAPCPVFGISSPPAGSTAATVTIAPIANATAFYAYTMVYISKLDTETCPAGTIPAQGSTAWCQKAVQFLSTAYLAGNTDYLALNSGGTGILNLSGFTGQRWAVLWDWNWNASQSCWYGPGGASCVVIDAQGNITSVGGASWRLQLVDVP